MAGKGASLTAQEKRIVKALLIDGYKSQDVHALINSGRSVTVNFGRIAGVKHDPNQEAASDDETKYFKLHRRAYDSQTGLNYYDDEKLIRSREAMILAVQIFNSCALKFKSEVFCVLANIAWTYLMHEYYARKLKVEVENINGFSAPLSEILERDDCPLSEGIKRNLSAIKLIRDKVEHHLLGRADTKWLGIFQACCLNFDKTICSLFGERLTLSGDLSFALQFAKMNLEQVTVLNKYEIPEHINAVDAQLLEGMTPDQLNNIEFQFQVIYTLSAAPKSKAHIQFVNPDSAEGREIHNVLAKKVVADELYPYKPGKVVKLVMKESKKSFTSHNHQQAIRYFNIRPKNGSPQPQNTDKNYCIYHGAHKDYTYSSEWVRKLVAAVSSPEEFIKIKAVRLL